MVTAGIPPEIAQMFRINDPNFQDGYVTGFNAAKRELIKELKALTKKIEKMEALVEATSTASNP